jgi:hypothetical protein
MVSIASSICLNGEEDEMIWQFHSSGIYSSHSLYIVINFRGVTPVYLPAVSKLSIPPKVHFFLWLVSKNKLLTRDNLEKRRKVEDTSCLFFAEKESVFHLLFECVVAKRELVSDVVEYKLGCDYESIAKLWLCNTKFGVINILTSAVC